LQSRAKVAEGKAMEARVPNVKLGKAREAWKAKVSKQWIYLASHYAIDRRKIGRLSKNNVKPISYQLLNCSFLSCNLCFYIMSNKIIKSTGCKEATKDKAKT
jgi:hypothetical protein